MLLDRHERRRCLLVLLLILVMGIVEMVGVASILPFLAVLSDPGVIERNNYLRSAYDWFGFDSHKGFLVAMSAGLFGVTLASQATKLVTQYAIIRFSSMRQYTISARLLQGYLAQPYTWFLNHHSADLAKTVLSEAGMVVTQVMLPALQLLSGGVLLFFLVTLLILMEPLVALAAAAILGGAYAVVYFSVRRRLFEVGAARLAANRARFQIAQEALGGIKDVKILGLEQPFLQRFGTPARRMARHQATAQIYRTLPRYALEALAFGGMLLLITIMLLTGDGTLGSILPVIGLFAFAGTRMLPALQAVYSNLASIRNGEVILNNLHRDLAEADRFTSRQTDSTLHSPLSLRTSLIIEDVHYAYPKSERAALRGLTLEIPARSTVGIIGTTGAGKTTAVDIILGLLQPDMGRLVVDGIPITEANLRAWQRSIGYVPQQIFLTDETVMGNIAFGIPLDKIDQAAVERAARIAELHEFIASDLPRGYETKVGERGVRLSGGQRQRIGIARALYRDPDVLILDEATSALDNLTERAVMDAVHNLGRAKTIIMIAHRLSTVRECDKIFMLENGQLVAEGSYDELMGSCSKFRTLTGRI
jgi:ATP-binding cassette, subfamily B, bacterial PglK